MPTVVQFRRGTTTQNENFTGAAGEISIDTQAGTLRVHNGITEGGSNIASVSYVTSAIGALSANSITSGTSNFSIIASGGNIIGNVAGATVTNIYSGGIALTGLLSATGNITGGNILTGGLISATSTITSSATVTGGNLATSGTASVTGNITGGNVLTGGLISATGNITTSSSGFIGVGTTTPDSEINILAATQTVSYTLTGNSTTQGTDLHISGANGSNTRITQDAFGTGSYVAFTGRTAGGTAATPTQTLSGDTLAQFTARGFSNGTAQFGNASTGRVDVVAAENFTDTSRATTVQILTTAAGSITPTAVATFSSASGLSVAGNVTGGNVTTAGILTVNSGAAATAIVNGAGNAVGNIGSSGTYFNRLFAQATTALYADLAEVYKADAKYPPGTVLVFGGDQEVTVSTQSHDARIAGVVSTNPAHVMNSGLISEYTVEVGLIGRVPCQVIGPIAAGDRVVSSSRAGVAERLDMQNYQPGVIIGKAVESYNGTGVGTIEVVVGRL